MARALGGGPDHRGRLAQVSGALGAGHDHRHGSVALLTAFEEAERVERAVAGCGARLGQVRTWRGAFAPFAAAIAASRLYVGYDSAGQHVAATCGVPLVTVFAGFQSPCAFARWRPTGPGPIEVVRVETPDAAKVLAEAVDAADRLLS